MMKRQISLADALRAEVPTSDDMGRAAKRRHFDQETDAFRDNLPIPTDGTGMALRATDMTTSNLGLRDGEAVVRIEPILSANSRDGALRADGRPWPIGSRGNQAYEDAWLQRHANQLDLTYARNKTMRFIGVLANGMRKAPISFLNVDVLRAQQAAAAQAAAQAQRLDVQRKVVPSDEKQKQIQGLMDNLQRVRAELTEIELPRLDANVPVPPYSRGTEVTRVLLDPAVAVDSVLHAFPYETRSADDAGVAVRSTRFETDEAHSLFALSRRVRLFQLAVRFAEPNNKTVLQDASRLSIAAADRPAIDEYISTAWPDVDLSNATDTRRRELFFATWAYDALRMQYENTTPLDLALATWHGAAALQLLANYTLFQDVIELTQPGDNDLASKLLKQASAAIALPDSVPPAYVRSEAWVVLQNVLRSLRGALQVAFAGHLDFIRSIDTKLEALLASVEYLRSPAALATAPFDRRGNVAVSIPPVRPDARIDVAKMLNVDGSVQAASDKTGVLDVGALTLVHALSRDRNVRPPTPQSAPLFWTEGPDTNAALYDVPVLLAQFTRNKGNLPSNAALMRQFAMLGRNIVLVQTRSDVPELRLLGQALGWVDLRTLEETLHIATAAVSLMARTHVAYLSKRGAIAPADHWRVLGKIPVPSPLTPVQEFLYQVLVPMAWLPEDLQTHDADLRARLHAAFEARLVSADAWANVEAISKELPIAFLYALATAQNKRDEQRRTELTALRTTLENEINAARRILAEIAGEEPRPMPASRLVSPQAYTQDLGWMQDPAIGGLAIINPATLGALEQARYGLKKYKIDALIDAPLELLTEHFESGLAVAFANFVIALDAKDELTHDRDFIRHEHYHEAPKRLFNEIQDLRRFTFTSAGTPGTYNVFDTVTGQGYYHSPPGGYGLEQYTVY
jgi:hypothetical protein